MEGGRGVIKEDDRVTSLKVKKSFGAELSFVSEFEEFVLNPGY